MSASEPSPIARFFRSEWSVILLLACCGYVTVSGCLTAPLIQLDDTIYVTENPLLQSDQPWSRLITEYFYYQRIPVTMVSYRLNAAVFGLDAAWAFRLINLLIHVASAYLLLKVLTRLGVRPVAALTIAVFWVMHPMACESVAWVSQRRNVLGFFFGILALYAYVRWHGQVAGWALSLVCYALALFSSPLALGWLPVFVALEVLGGPAALTRSGSRLFLKPALRGFAGLVPLMLLTGWMVFSGISGYARTMRPPPGGSVLSALLTDTDLFLRYLLNALVPVRLSAMYGVDAIESLGDARFWANLLVWIGLIAGSVFMARSRGRCVLGWLWFFGALGPACNIVAIGYPMQDRYLYIALAGLFLVAAETGAGLMQRTLDKKADLGRLVCPILLSFLGGWFAYATLQRSVVWSDSLLLMQDAVEAQPRAALSHIFYARQLGRVADEFWVAGREEAAREANRAAVMHLDEGLRQSDAYLFNPLFAEMLLARNLVDAGEPKRAIGILEGRLPAPDAPKLEFGNGPPCYTYVGSRYQFTYTLSRESLCSGYRELARAYLHQFIEEPLSHDASKPLLKQASANSVKALKVLPGSSESQCLRACILLAEESYLRKDIGPEEAVAESRERVRQTERPLQLLSGISAVSEDLKKDVSLARIRALGCLGLARARFEPLLTRNFPPDETLQRFNEALQWAGRAGELDPMLGEAHLYFARIQHFLMEQAQANNNQAIVEQQREKCIEALQRVSPESACYPRAQKNLKVLTGGASP